MIHRFLFAAFPALVFILLLALPSLSQGIIIPPGQTAITTHPIYSLPITIQSETVNINIDDNVATIESKLTLKNNTLTTLQGTYIFPIPVDADIANFVLYLDGKPLMAETLEAAKAQAIYQDIVRRMRDPGLLQFVGQGLVQAQVYPIPANSTREIKISYTQILSEENDNIKLVYPLRLDGFSTSAIGTLSISLDISVPDKLGLIYSPSHTIEVNRHNPSRAVVGYEGKNIRPQGDFVLFIGPVPKTRWA